MKNEIKPTKQPLAVAPVSDSADCDSTINFKKIQPHIEVVVPQYFDDKREVKVLLLLHASADGATNKFVFNCSGSIHKHQTMMQLQQLFIKHFEDYGYEYVSIIDVFIDEEFLAEYKVHAKTINKEESSKLMNVVHQLLGKHYR